MQQWLGQWHRPLFVGLLFLFLFFVYLSTLLSHTHSLSEGVVDTAIFLLFTLFIAILSAMGYLIYFFWNVPEAEGEALSQEKSTVRLQEPATRIEASEVKIREKSSLKQIQDHNYRGFGYLERLEEAALQKYLEPQHPQIIALVLLMIDGQKSRSVLSSMDAFLAEKVSEVMSEPAGVSEQQIEKLDLALQEELLELYVECKLLHQLQEHEIRRLLLQVNKKELIYALKGVTQELQERFLANMSPKTRSGFHQLLVHAPQVSQENSDKAIKKLSLLAKQLRENGKIRATN